MFTESAHRLKIAAPLLLTELRVILTHGGGRSCDGRRHLNVSPCLYAKATSWKKPQVKVDIPGLEPITYADRMHYVPGLAKPKFQTWVQDFRDPLHPPPPEPEESLPLYKEKPCYVFHQRTNVLEGVKQALWLTKTKMIQGLPAQVLALAQDPANQIENQDERVQNAIKYARFWDTTESRPPRERFCMTLLHKLLHLCGGLQASHPGLGGRILAEKYRPVATWTRGEDLFQVRGQNGVLLASMAPLPVVAGKEEVQDTADHTLETFYPISPTIDLASIKLYQDTSHTGFRGDYPYPHAHTVLIPQDGQTCKLLPDQLRAKMIMFAFANALTRAQSAPQTEDGVLEQPVVVQAVGTNGRVFQFLVFQLNTTSLQADGGVKNLAWVDEDQLLYDFAKIRPLIKKREVQVPAGLSGYNPQTFQKFLSLYLHGGV